MDVETVLQESGFSPVESKIYIYLLERGASLQQNISSDLSLLRQTVYEIMGKMESKGFVSVSKSSRKKFYTAVHPNIIQARLEERTQELKNIVPSLISKLNSGKEPHLVDSFRGMVGLKNLFQLTLSSKKAIYWLANEEMHVKIFQDYYWLNYSRKREASKIPIKLLVEERKKHEWKTENKRLREVREFKHVSSISDASYVVFGDSVILYNFVGTQITGVLIKNFGIAKMFENLFLQSWNSAKKVD